VGRVGNRYVWQGGQTENQGGQTEKKFFGASRRILPTLAWNPAGAIPISQSRITKSDLCPTGL